MPIPNRGIMSNFYFCLLAIQAVSFAQENRPSQVTMARQVQVTMSVPRDVGISASTEVVAFLFDHQYRSCSEESAISVEPVAKSDSELLLTAKLFPDRLYYAIVLLRQSNADGATFIPLLNLTLNADTTKTTVMPVMDNLSREMYLAEVGQASAIIANHLSNQGAEGASSHLINVDSDLQQSSQAEFPSVSENAVKTAESSGNVFRTASLELQGAYFAEDGRVFKLPIGSHPFFVFDELLDRDVTHGVTLQKIQLPNPQYGNALIAATNQSGQAKLNLKVRRTYSLITNSLVDKFSPVTFTFLVNGNSHLLICTQALDQLPLDHQQALLEKAIARIGHIVYPDGDRNPDDTQKISKIDGPNDATKLQHWEHLEFFLGQLEGRLGQLNATAQALDATKQPIDLLIPLYQAQPNQEWVELLQLASRASQTRIWAIINPNSGPNLPGWKQNYAAAIRQAQRLPNFNLLGYVSATNNGLGRSANEILADALAYADACEGVFIDNYDNFTQPAELRGLYEAIKRGTSSNAFSIFACPGSALPPHLADELANAQLMADYFCVGNGTDPSYEAVGLVADFISPLPLSARPGLGVIHRSLNLETAAVALHEAKESGASFVSFTDLDGPSSTQRLPNRRLLSQLFEELEQYNRLAKVRRHTFLANPPAKSVIPEPQGLQLPNGFGLDVLNR